MSMEEDTELRDIVLETLEQRGVIGKTKAMLRASVFTALEETTAPEDRIFLLNKKMRESLSTPQGKVMASLIMDYFDFFELEFCKTVFEPETGFSDKINRRDLMNSLGVASDDRSCPLLAHLISARGVTSGPHAAAPVTDLTSKQIADARSKFTKYDTNGNGTIDKNELRSLFMDIYPSFHQNMLDRYVNDEFKAADKDFSSSIDFDEFLVLYRRLFVLCRSVVSHQAVDLPSPGKAASPRHSKIPVKNPRMGSPRTSESEATNKIESKSKIKSPPGSSLPDIKKGAGDTAEVKTIDQKIADFGFEVADDDDDESSTRHSEDYDDDFEKSGASSNQSKNRRSKSDVSPDESIKTESLTEDTHSAAANDDEDDIDALLKDNDISWGIETTDKTVDDDDSLKGVDFWEFSSKQ